MKVLDVNNLEAGYGRIKVLHGISLSVDQGHVAVLLGANGAGKTTTLRAISGLIKSQWRESGCDRAKRCRACGRRTRHIH
jgi:branched-chain amino acid transport system ATP-binding protein